MHVHTHSVLCIYSVHGGGLVLPRHDAVTIHTRCYMSSTAWYVLHDMVGNGEVLVVAVASRDQAGMIPDIEETLHYPRMRRKG